ncbi:hypothetical protein BH09ACT4_BH09ACT4_07320 [soil metagenome]
MTSRATRVARGWLVGVFATALAALSHSIAGGGTPSALALGLGAVFGGMLGTVAFSARPSLARLTIAVGVSQLMFHLAFSTLGAGAASGSVGHVHEQVFSPVSLATHAHTNSPLMWLSHAAAGLLTLALLRGAERAAWRLLNEFARLVVAPFRTARAIVIRMPRPAPRNSSSPARLFSLVLVSAVSRRGPPLSVAF